MALGDNIKRNTQEQKTFNEAINEGALAYREYEDLFKSIQGELGKKVSAVKDASKSYDQLVSATSQLKLNEEEITRLSDKQIQQNQNKAKAALEDLKHAAESLSFQKQKLINDKNGNLLQGAALEARIKSKLLSGEISKEEAALLRAKATNFKLEEEMVEKAGEDVEKRTKLNEALGVTGNSLKGLNELAGNFAGAFGLDEVQKDMEKFAEDSIKSGKSVSRLQTLGVGVVSAFGQLGKTLTDPAVIFTSILKTFAKFEAANKQVRQLTGASAANFKNLAASAEAATNSSISLIDITKTIGSLSAEIGINVGAAFSSDTLIAASELTELLGLGAAETANMALRAEVFGDDLGKAGTQAEGIVKDFAKQGKGALNVQQVMANAGKASNALSMSIKGGQEGLLKAAANAQALGLNLEQAEAIADSLLQFQSSIEAEMEAELLTGKQINLEKARMAALNNDIATLTEEIASNTEIQEAFSSGNRIQQEAIAKSLGMSKDDVAKMILLSEKNKNLTEEQRAAAAGISIEEAKRLSVQDSINKSIEQMTAAFAPILDIVAKIVSSKFGMGALKAIILGIVTAKAVGGISKMAKSFTSMKDSVTEIAKETGGGKGKALVKHLTGDTDKAAEATKSAKAGGAKQGKGVKGFLKGLGDGLASIGKQAADVIKGGLALGVVGVILGGSFALAMMMVKDVDPVQMIAFAGALAIFGATAALIGKLGGQVMQGAAALLVMGLALVPAAFAFSLLEGLDTDALIAFSIALPLLALAAAGLGFIAPFILAGSVAIGALGLALIPLAYGFSQMEGADSVGIVTSLATFAGLAPGLAAVAGSLFAVAGGLGAMALAGIAALPVMAGLAGLGTVATGIAGVLGLGDEGGEGEATPASNDTTILAQKLDQMNATLNAILAKEGTVTLDGTKVGTALTVASSKLQ